jgi:hypothetical protein
MRRCLIRGAIRFLAFCVPVAGLLLVSVPGSVAPLHAACTASDLGDALEASYHTFKDITTSSQCAPLVSNPAFWITVGVFSAGTVSSQELRNACNTIQDVANTTGDSKEKANSALQRLPPSVRKALEENLPIGAESPRAAAWALRPDPGCR